MKKALAAACAVLGIVTVVFGALAVYNFVSVPETVKLEESAADFVLSQDVIIDAPAQSLAKIMSKDMKEQAEYPEGIREELKQPYAVNNNLVGWLTIPGTELDTAILQGKDNSYYLKRDFYERLTYETINTNYGNIYLDYRCLKDGISNNMVFHGHTTGKSDGIPKQSFRSLYDFRDLNHFKENPIIKYTTLTEEYTYKICAVFLSSTQKKDDNGYMFNYIYPDMGPTSMEGYIEQVNQRKLYETGVSLEPTDKIITLSTCIYDFGKSIDTRLVVVGRLLHEGESEAIDPALVKNNPEFRRPQAWYNAKGKANPYKDSAKWEPGAN